MAETEKGRMNPFQRRLIEGFVQGSQISIELEEGGGGGGDSEEIELSLGLSLNGRFGVDPKAKKLKRSSSIADFLNPLRDVVETTSALVPAIPYTPLTRTCSLPIETEEEWRKRKESQMIRRMEAKRKRSEKQRNLRAGLATPRGSVEENGGESNGVDEKSNGFKQNHCRKNSWEVSGPLGLVPTWANGVKVGFLAHGVEHRGNMGNGFVGSGGGEVGGEGFPQPPPLMQQGSGGSRGSGSSGISESDNKFVRETNKHTEPKTLSSVQSLPAPKDPRMVVPIERSRSGKVRRAEVLTGSPASEVRLSSNGASEIVKNVLSDMPCVTTEGDGPDGKKIQGFLYRYRKGEEVRIVCVCHGSFLTPAEFVKHAGGGDVDHPLRHIVVNLPFCDV
ncbi:hypothetical protein Ancab_018339 [Ancistrocladus abbreviatus]